MGLTGIFLKYQREEIKYLKDDAIKGQMLKVRGVKSKITQLYILFRYY